MVVAIALLLFLLMVIPTKSAPKVEECGSCCCQQRTYCGGYEHLWTK
jgi:hypothetical protein